MKTPDTGKAYVRPTLAEYGKIIARTEFGGIYPPIEADMQPSRA